MPRPVHSHDTDAARHHDCPTSGRSVGRRQRCLQLPRGNATAQSPGGDSRRASGPGEYEPGGSLHALLHRDTGSRGSSGVGRITADLTGGRTIPFGGKEWTVNVPVHAGGVTSTGGHTKHGELNMILKTLQTLAPEFPKLDPGDPSTRARSFQQWLLQVTLSLGPAGSHVTAW